MRKPQPATIDSLSAMTREEFTTLNILVQALNRELRDCMLTTLREVNNIGQALRIAPVYGPANAPATTRARPAAPRRGSRRRAA